MVVVMAEGASEEQIQNVVAHLVEQGFDVHRSTGAQRTVLGAVGRGRHRDPRLLEVLDGVNEWCASPSRTSSPAAVQA
jgi:3-deoxy-7-phosphoheptulonate synthase